MGHTGFLFGTDGSPRLGRRKEHLSGKGEPPADSVGFQRGKPVIGHYTQMVWKKTNEVGCATADSNTLSLLVCRYSPGGNLYGETPY